MTQLTALDRHGQKLSVGSYASDGENAIRVMRVISDLEIVAVVVPGESRYAYRKYAAAELELVHAPLLDWPIRRRLNEAAKAIEDGESVDSEVEDAAA